MPEIPVELLPTEDIDAGPERGTGLCLSGGGYRAMVFHTGVLWRLYEAGVLKSVDRISSVSGGSIIAGLLALRWNQLSFDPAGSPADFVSLVVSPIRSLASETIDAESIILGLALPGRVSDRVAASYERHLFGVATLQDLPDRPRFVINATNVQSGAIWRFMKPYMRDWRVGEVRNPTVRLSHAVAASSAFPPVLSPFELRLDPGAFTPKTGQDLQRPPFTTNVILSDGGVYDNLGLETVKGFKTVLVSDAGQKILAQEHPDHDWARHSLRVLDTIDNQVRSLRKRRLIEDYDRGDHNGAFWGIKTDFADYHLKDDPLDCLHRTPQPLADIATRLEKMPRDVQDRLMNWGYAICDAALRAHVDDALQEKLGIKIVPPTVFPFAGGY